MGDKRYQFALVGCGRIAQRHAGHIAQLGDVKAVFDVSADAAKSFAEANKATAYTDFNQMLASEPEVDVVSILTPNGFHAKQAIAALNAGFHVLCEKPMAINVHDCGEMIKAAERANRRLFIVKQNRFNPPVLQVKDWIDEGRLGRILSFHLSCLWNRNEQYYRGTWKGSKDLDGGALYTLFSHFIDLIYWMVGDISEVQAMVDNLNHGDLIETEDTGGVVLRSYSGAIGTIHYTTNAYAGNMEGSLTLFGEKGTVKIGGQYLNELEYVRIEGMDGGGAEVSASSYKKYDGSQAQVDKVYVNLIDVLEGRGVISTNGFEGLKTVEIIDRIYRAANYDA